MRIGNVPPAEINKWAEALGVKREEDENEHGFRERISLAAFSTWKDGPPLDVEFLDRDEMAARGWPVLERMHLPFSESFCISPMYGGFLVTFPGPEPIAERGVLCKTQEEVVDFFRSFSYSTRPEADGKRTDTEG